MKNEERLIGALTNDKKEGTVKFEDKANARRTKTEIIFRTDTKTMNDQSNIDR